MVVSGSSPSSHKLHEPCPEKYRRGLARLYSSWYADDADKDGWSDGRAGGDQNSSRRLHIALAHPRQSSVNSRDGPLLSMYYYYRAEEEQPQPSCWFNDFCMELCICCLCIMASQHMPLCHIRGSTIPMRPLWVKYAKTQSLTLIESSSESGRMLGCVHGLHKLLIFGLVG